VGGTARVRTELLFSFSCATRLLGDEPKYPEAEPHHYFRSAPIRRSRDPKQKPVALYASLNFGLFDRIAFSAGGGF